MSSACFHSALARTGRSISQVSLVRREAYMPGNPLRRQIEARLRNLFKMLSGTWRDSTRQLSADVGPQETLSSFVFRQDQVDRKTNTIRHTRLVPRRNRENERLEVSVCRSTELSEEQVWTLCSNYFDRTAPVPAIGRGVGPASAVYAEKLGFDADGKPYPEHANIVGWHDEVGKPAGELKHFWIDQAQRMAAKFSYRPRR